MGWRLALPRFGEAGGGEALPGRIGERRLDQTGLDRPVAQCLQPGFEVAGAELAAVHLARGDRGGEQRLQFIGPRRPRRLQPGQLGSPPGAGVGQRFGRRRRGVEQVDVGEQAVECRQQRLRAGPPQDHLRRQGDVERCEKRAPVIAHRCQPLLALVGLEGLREQAATVEGVFAQHAVAPAVDRRHRRLVHPFGGELQPARAAGVLRGRVGGTQFAQQRVDRLVIGAESLGGLGQPRPDALAQLLGGGLGKGHDQDLGRRQRPRAGAAIAVAKHQTQVQRGNRVGLAGAGAGLDQPAADEREGERIERQRNHCSVSVAGPIAARSGASSATTQWVNSPPATSSPKSGQARCSAAQPSRSPMAWGGLPS